MQQEYYIHDTHEGIISRETFQKVQESFQNNASCQVKTSHLFVHRIQCPQCERHYRYIRSSGKSYWGHTSQTTVEPVCKDIRLPEESIKAAFINLVGKLYTYGDSLLSPTLRSVLTPETADSEYTIRTKINELQKERKNLIAKALAENDDGKYDFQFTRIKQELEQLQAQLGGVQAVQKAQAVDEVRMAEITALLEKFKESDLTFDDLLVRKVVETVRVESTEKLEITFKDGNRKVVELPGRK